MATPNYPTFTNTNATSAVTALRQIGWDSLVKSRKVIESIFFTLSGVMIDEKTPVPNAWLMRSRNDNNGAREMRFPLALPLSGAETKGDSGSQLDNIENLTMKFARAYRNEVSHAAGIDQYGIKSLDEAPYGLKERIAQALADYWQEMLDYYMQYAIINRWSPNLLESPINQSVDPHKNTFVKGLNLANQPYTIYNTTPTFFNGVIAASLDLADALATDDNLAWDIGSALALIEHFTLQTKAIPFSIGGRESFIMAVPSSQITRTLNPATTDGLEQLRQNSNQLNSEEQKLPGVRARIRNTIIIENPRAPTVRTYGTGSGSGSGVATTNPTNSVLEYKYLKPGNNDERHTTGDIWEPVYMLGQSGMAEFEVGQHTEMEVQDFKRRKATGIFNVMGFSRADYDVDTETAGSRDNFSSAILYVKKQSSNW